MAATARKLLRSTAWYREASRCPANAEADQKTRRKSLASSTPGAWASWSAMNASMATIASHIVLNHHQRPDSFVTLTRKAGYLTGGSHSQRAGLSITRARRLTDGNHNALADFNRYERDISVGEVCSVTKMTGVSAWRCLIFRSPRTREDC